MTTSIDRTTARLGTTASNGRSTYAWAGSIRAKLWSILILFAAAYLASVLLEWWQSSTAQRRIARAASSLFSASLQSDQAKWSFHDQAQSYQDAVLLGAAVDLETASTDGKSIQAALRAIANLPDLEPQDRSATLSLIEQHQAFTRDAEALYPSLSSDTSAENHQQQAFEMYRRTAQLKDSFAELTERFANLLRSELQSTVDDSRKQRNLDAFIFTIVASGTFLLVSATVRQITRRLQGLVVASDRLAGGDFATVVADPIKDEVGALSSSFASMRDAVRGRDHELRELNASLENSVRARTEELSQRNADLEREIHDRERAQESLRLLESAVTQSEDMVAIAAARPGGEPPAIVFVNPAFTRSFGPSAADAKDRALDLVAGHGDSTAAIRAWVATAIAGDHGFGEASMRCADGVSRPAEWHVGPIRDANGRISHVVAIVHDISARKVAEAELEQVHRRLLDASRQAGQAEVATGVLHNVGNVLNSINVAATVVTEKVRSSRVEGLGKVVALIEGNRADLPGFLAGERGLQTLAFLALLAQALAAERISLLDELQRLAKNIDHVKDIVSMQQAYAGGAGFSMMVQPQELMDDALRMLAAGLERRHVTVVREYEAVPSLLIDKHRVLQILVNLVRNAKEAMDGRDPGARRLVARIARSGGDRLTLSIADNGVGISAENLQRIFSHGFTTKPDGHGFGLHSSVLAAKEMRGDVLVHSDGPGCGATFTLEIPV